MMNLPSVWTANQPRHRVLILRHDTRRVSTTVPESLEATLTFALTRFPSLRPPLHITRDIPEAGGAVEISEEVWKTELIDIDGILILDVHETGAREMSVEKDDSNASVPLPALPAVPEAVTETMEARTNKEDPLIAHGRSEAAIAQAEPIPKTPPVEPVSKTPPPSPPAASAELVTSQHRWIDVYVEVYIDQNLSTSHFRVHPTFVIWRIRRNIAQIYLVKTEQLEGASSILHDGQRVPSRATVADLLNSIDGEETSLHLELHSVMTGGIPEESFKIWQATGKLPPHRPRRDLLSQLLKPLPATDPYVP